MNKKRKMALRCPRVIVQTLEDESDMPSWEDFLTLKTDAISENRLSELDLPSGTPVWEESNSSGDSFLVDMLENLVSEEEDHAAPSTDRDLLSDSDAPPLVSDTESDVSDRESEETDTGDVDSGRAKWNLVDALDTEIESNRCDIEESRRIGLWKHTSDSDIPICTFVDAFDSGSFNSFLY